MGSYGLIELRYGVELGVDIKRKNVSIRINSMNYMWGLIWCFEDNLLKFVLLEKILYGVFLFWISGLKVWVVMNNWEVCNCLCKLRRLCIFLKKL